MKSRGNVDRLLRWYPARWRSRYGAEFLALVEDRLDGSSLTIGLRLSVAAAGIRERCYASGVLGSQSSPSMQRRTGSLMVLVAWSIMVIGGASLVKSAEHFAVSMPATSRVGAQLAYTSTAVAGIVGTLLVATGAIVALPGFVRLIREEHWSDVRTTFAKPVVASVVLGIAILGLSSWAHHLDALQRNGSDDLYSGAFIAFALLAVMTIGLWVRASVIVASRIDFTARALRWESWLAFGVSISSLVVIGSTILWWIQVGLHAPWFLEGLRTGTATSPWSVNLIVTVLVMGLATVTALWGSSRIAATYRPTRLSAG